MLAGQAQNAERFNSAVREQHSEATLLASPLQFIVRTSLSSHLMTSSGAVKANRD
jgi:hypothetical protein